MLANLDNEVIFKKAFTDMIVFKGFVKDILGINIEVDKIETEKRFKPKIGHIDFKLDIFAESTDNRVIVEIQRIEYDYNFDRFLHYFLMSISELQRSFKTYGVNKTVYGIVVMTAPYKMIDRTGRAVLDEVMISGLNPKNLKGEEIQIFNHQLFFLNSYHKSDDTPKDMRDWLELIYESIHNPENPQINNKKKAIKRAAKIINTENLTAEEWAQRKKTESAKVAKKIGEDMAREEGIEKGIEKIAIRCIKQGMNDEEISKITGLTIDEIKNIRKRQ